jgi:hypothetical protein
VRYYFDLQTGEILDSEVIAEGNTCDNECPPGDMFCDEYFGWGGTEEPSSEDVTKVFTVSIFSDPNSFGLQAGVTLRGKKFDNRTLSYFTHQPNATLLSNGLVCMYTSPQYCDVNDDRYINPVSINCNSRLSVDAKTANASISIVVSHPRVPNEEDDVYEKSFTWMASQHLY